jgi:hypothetical protein
MALGQEATHSVFRPMETTEQPSARLRAIASFFSPSLPAVRRRNITIALLACIVMLVLGVSSILYLAGSHGQHSTSRGGSHSQSNGLGSIATNGPGTATGAATSPSSSPTAGKSATYTPAQPTPTTPVSPPTASPTATSVGGQTVNIHGRVSNISLANNTFVVTTRSGVSDTIDVNSSTKWITDGQGGATSLATLQSGTNALVTCTVQSNGSCLALQVFSSDN